MRRPDGIGHVGDAGHTAQDRAGAVHPGVITRAPQLRRPAGSELLPGNLPG